MENGEEYTINNKYLTLLKDFCVIKRTGFCRKYQMYTCVYRNLCIACVWIRICDSIKCIL